VPGGNSWVDRVSGKKNEARQLPGFFLESFCYSYHGFRNAEPVLEKS
jgi:hypothetical protein